CKRFRGGVSPGLSGGGKRGFRSPRPRSRAWLSEEPSSADRTVFVVIELDKVEAVARSTRRLSSSVGGGASSPTRSRPSASRIGAAPPPNTATSRVQQPTPLRPRAALRGSACLRARRLDGVPPHLESRAGRKHRRPNRSHLASGTNPRGAFIPS